MVDIQTVSIVIASASVVAGVVYYALQLRHQARARQDMVKTRQADLLMRLYSTWGDESLQRAAWTVGELKFKDYDDFVKKYGKPISTAQVPMSFLLMGNYFEQVGILLRNKLIEPSLISQLVPVENAWEKVNPLVEGLRKDLHDPELWEWFEYLYNETKRRKQRGV